MTELRLSSYGSTLSSKATEALHWWPGRDLKISRSNINNHVMDNVETEVHGMFTLMDADSLACACGTLGLVVPEQKKGNFKLLLKCISRQF